MGLLTGAMAGLGAGLSQTGDFLMRVTADEEKEKRLRQYEMAREQRQNQRQDMIRSEDRQWQLEDYQTQRGDQVEDRDFQANFTLQRDDTQYERQMAMERYRQSQQNARSAASRRQQPAWQLMPDGNGGYIQYDPVTNQSRAANLPEGVGATNEWGDRDKALMGAYESEYSALSKRAETMGIEALDPSEQRRLQELPTLMQQHILGVDASDVDAELDAALGAGGDGAPSQGIIGSAMAEDAPSAQSHLESRAESQQQAEADRQADQQVERMADDAVRTAGRITIPQQEQPFVRGGPTMRPARSGPNEAALREGKAQLQAIAAAHDAETDPHRKAVLQNAMEKLQDAGVSL